MVSFGGLILGPGVPIYLQIIRYLKRAMVAGEVRDGDEMPSRRVLSSLLGVNPNTIQKAYRLLEEERLICSHAGAKSYVTLSEAQLTQIRRQLLEDDARTLVEAMKQMGVEKAEALHLIEELW
ncbi:MAG: GntR family transcriptional regulator [Candidatus Avoscillospira sp.]